ncbi:autophagy-related protein 9A-like [Amphiura filiformis]|uniref:autophagy-related protein 9A-like n=1 Tax=Amphiura filiformis TaxID=82378 RepID=UPI003B20C021
MAGLQTEYRRLESTDDHDDPVDDQDVMLHMPEGNKTRWSHIENLDEFFTRIYQYHQKHGYLCMMLAQVFELVQFLFIVIFSLFLLRCVDYDVLFGDSHNSSDKKVTLPDAIYPLDKCSRNPPGALVICVMIAGVFWLHRLVRVIYNAWHYWEIRLFYLTALKISADELLNLTWHDVLKRLQHVQKEQRMCIHKADLTELDIYHRILRFKNYMIAMVNKSLLPLKHEVPFLGETVFLTNGLKYNLELILFWGPWSPFQNYWHLKEDYKKAAKREQLAQQLSKHILWVGLVNFLLMPFILLWQLLYSFFNYTDLIKRNPSTLGARRWSAYARLYVRHFNELDHEFTARLNRGYRPAARYLGAFSSNILTVVSQNIAFFAGSILAVLIILTVIDEDVLTVEHVLTAMTLLGLIVTVCRTFIPDENLIWCPETQMQSILAQIHYIPDSWKGVAHTYRVRDEFAQLFQYKFTHFAEELLSPIVTPFVLCFHLRTKTLDIVDFYRNFSVDVVGVGDVCSFAQMDIRTHGNPRWLSEGKSEASQYQQAEDGKTELSLMHFTMTNPKWKPPQQSEYFINALKEQAQRDIHLLNTVDAENTAMATSIRSITSLEGGGYNSILSSLAMQQGMAPAGMPPPLAAPPRHHTGSLRSVEGSPKGTDTTAAAAKANQPKVRGAISSTEGPLQTEGGLLSSMHTSGPLQTSVNFSAESYLPMAQAESIVGPSTLPGLQSPTRITPTSDLSAATEMNISALYMHQLHDRSIILPGHYPHQI